MSTYHFYGSIQGQRGQATRTGNIDSGFSAWAQNVRSRVSLYMWADRGRDYADVVIKPSSLNYGGRSQITLCSGVDIDALLKHADDPKVSIALSRAGEAMREANLKACKLENLVEGR